MRVSPWTDAASDPLVTSSLLKFINHSKELTLPFCFHHKPAATSICRRGVQQLGVVFVHGKNIKTCYEYVQQQETATEATFKL
jgi:hypothetical protein